MLMNISNTLLQNLVGQCFLIVSHHYCSAKELSEEDLDMLQTFSLKVEDGPSEETWAKIMHTYNRHNTPLLKVTKAFVEFLAAYHPAAYDYCINSCICYVGPHKAKMHCQYCKEPRKNSNGHTQKTFTYSPIIPWLKAYFKNLTMIKKLRYISIRFHF